MQGEFSEEIENYIKDKLGLHRDVPKIELKEKRFNQIISPDLIFKNRDIVYIIEIKTRATTLNGLAQLNLLKDLWHRYISDQEEIKLVLVSKVLGPQIELIAKDLNIICFSLPLEFALPDNHETFHNRGITSDKSWNVISCLIKERISSIRGLSIKTGVSYAWTYKTIKKLENMGVTKKEGDFVQISDIKKLISGIAWERPLKKLISDEFFVDFSSSIDAAKTISSTLKNQGIDVVFTAYTSGGLYTNYGVRQDSIELYLKKSSIHTFKSIFESIGSCGIKLMIITPDRDVFSNIFEKESILVASPSQTLLDLAGLGYSAMDLTLSMIEKYADL